MTDHLKAVHFAKLAGISGCSRWWAVDGVPCGLRRAVTGASTSIEWYTSRRATH